MDVAKLSERDIITKYILPSIRAAGFSDAQIREEVSFTAGRIFVSGRRAKRGERKRADIIIYHKSNIPIAVVEAKKSILSVGAGIQQALEYADILDIPVAVSANGSGFVVQYRKNCGGNGSNGEPIITQNLSEFPSPSHLWECYKRYNSLVATDAQLVAQSDYYVPSDDDRKPRYYQRIAINRTVEAVARGQNRILLVMATGTGKTYTAFQIIYRLWKSGVKKRILYLADRTNLITQTKKADFKNFKEKLTIIEHKQIDKAYEIYLALYQGLSGREGEDDAYLEFSPNFFDLIVVDECHRGSVDEDKAWHKILTYFSSATQIGMTATPKETRELSNIEYFGEPIYTYSLAQGIDDGFLAPYKVIRVGLNVDLEGYRPERGKTDVEGELVEDRLYNTKDFDRNLVIDERTKVVASKVMEFLKNSNPLDKTIVFCVDIEHADRMRRALLSFAPSEITAKTDKYVVRITGDDHEAKGYLEDFIDEDKVYPVIATTSKLMTTGTDAKTCKLIVLDANIGSMTEFKQIIGRGTRVYEDYDKLFFTIMDFRGVTDKFADKDFDGAPIKIKEVSADTTLDEASLEDGDELPQIDPQTGEEIKFEEGMEANSNLNGKSGEFTDAPEAPREKVFIKGVDVSVLNVRKQILDAEGKLVTVSLADYVRDKITGSYRTLDDFLQGWSNAEKKAALLDELEAHDIDLEELRSQTAKLNLDIFDLICHVAWDAPALTRSERAAAVRKRNYWSKYGERARAVLEALLAKYADEGIENIEDTKVLKLEPFNAMGTPKEIITLFGDKSAYAAALRELESEIYKTNASML